MSEAFKDLTKDQPTVPFFSLANEAKDWVSLASLNERKHYAAAILNSFKLSDKVGFLRFVERMVAK